MNNAQRKFAIIPYIFVSFVHLLAIGLENSQLVNFSKAFLMPALVLYLFSLPIKLFARRFLLLGLVASWLGDLLLIWQIISPNFFIFGLLSFLVAHIFYIILNFYDRILKTQFWQIIALIPMLCWAIFLLQQVAKKDSGFLIPILLYAIILCVLYYSALIAHAKMAIGNWIYLFCGIIIFIASDSMIAIAKFVTPFPHSGLAIMSTYIFAQFLIIYSNSKHYATI